MYRFGSLLVGIVMLVALVAACNVQIADDGTFEVYGTEPTPTLTSREDEEGNIIEYEITPTPVFDGRLSDWNIQGVQHIEATPTPWPTATPAYQQGELRLVGVGPLTLASLAVPRGRYIVHYRVAGNDGNQYCITYGDVLSIGCTSGSIGDVDHNKRVTINSVGVLSVQIGVEASYSLQFERVD